MRKVRGFTLIELAMVFAIIGFLFVFFINTTTTLLSNRSRDATRTKLAAIETALALYVTTNKRLPCPADGTLAVPNANAGVEAPGAGVGTQGGTGNCLNNQTTGVVPWVALGLSQADVMDSWNNLITYRVDPNLTIGPPFQAAGGMDMSWCDPAGTAAAVGGLCLSTGCTAATCTSPANFLAGPKGISIQDSSGNVLMNSAANPSTGAAYVLISHGDNQVGAYNANGVVLTTGVGAAEGTTGGELQNANNTALQAFYVDNNLVEADNGTTHFDDIAARPSILSVINAANLGPRAH